MICKMEINWKFHFRNYLKYMTNNDTPMIATQAWKDRVRAMASIAAHIILQETN